MPTAAGSEQLNYAPTPDGLARQRVRLVLLVVLGLLLLASAWRWGLIPHARFLLLQRRCMAYAPPPGRVIYDDDPRQAAALLTDPAYAASHPALPKGVSAAVYDNPLFRAYVQGSYRRLRPAGPAAFMHRRTSPAGNERLVVVEFPSSPPTAQLGKEPGRTPLRQLAFRPYAEPPSTLTARGAAVLTFPGDPPGLDLFVAPGDRTRVLEGQPDPADPSHFTIDYVHNGVPGTIDGWLNDDDTVTLAPRAGQVVEHDATYRWWSPAPGRLPGAIINSSGTHFPRDVTIRPVRPKGATGNAGAGGGE